MRATSRSHRTRGASFIESMIAMTIIAVCLMAVIALWRFGFQMTTRNEDTSVAYNIGRRAVEKVKILGFKNVAIGATTLYYDNQGGNESGSTFSGAVYSVTTTIDCPLNEQVTHPSDGTTRPADYALVSVTVTVRKIATNEVIVTTGTQLARSGV